MFRIFSLLIFHSALLLFLPLLCDFIIAIMSPPLTAPPECYSTDFDIRKACRQACTLETCPMKLSYWAYIPSLAANGTFTALFSLSLALYIIQAVYSRRFIGFSVAMLCGSVLEVIGYVGRIMSYHNPFDEVWSPNSTHLLLRSSIYCICIRFRFLTFKPQTNP